MGAGLQECPGHDRTSVGGLGYRMMLKYHASDKLRGGVCWPEGEMHIWGLRGIIGRVTAGIVTGAYHASFWPDRVVQTSTINGMRAALVSGFSKHGSCCEWMRWEVE